MTALGRACFALAILMLGLSVCAHFTIGFWGDQDWELLVARMLLGGRKLYVDHVSVIPPLIFYLYTLPAALALHAGFLQDFQALVLLALFCIALTIWVCTTLIALHPAFAGNRTQQLQFALLLSYLFVFRILSPFFADREHIFLVLTFPYLLRWMPSLSNARIGLRSRALIGALAAVGFLIKPHCLMVFAGLQVIYLLRKDGARILLSVENGIIVLSGAIYALGIWLFMPDYFSPVLQAAMSTYSAISAGTNGLFTSTLLGTIFFTFVMFCPKQASPYRKDIYYFVAVAPLLYGYTLINSGWGYTYQPIITLLLFINTFVLWEFFYLRRTRSASGATTWQCTLGAGSCAFNLISKFAVAGLYYVSVFGYLGNHCSGDRNCPGYYTQYVKEVEASPRPRSFGMIGMNYALWARVSKLSGAAWETRFPQMWMIPKFVISGPEFTENHRWILYYVAGALADDLNQKKPEVMFVESSRALYTIELSKPLDWIAEFDKYVNFYDAWQHYAYVTTVDGCDALDPYQAVIAAMQHVSSVAPENRAGCRYDVYHRIK